MIAPAGEARPESTAIATQNEHAGPVLARLRRMAVHAIRMTFFNWQTATVTR